MFVWTPEHVLTAIDAGIPEVISLFNRAHLNAQVNGVGLHGPRVALTPVRNPRLAFAVAMDTTVCILNLLDERTALAPVARPTAAEITFIEALDLDAPEDSPF